MGKYFIIIFFASLLLTGIERGIAYFTHIQDPYLHEGKVLQLHYSFYAHTDKDQLHWAIKTGEITNGRVYLYQGQYVKIKSLDSDVDGYLKVVKCDKDGNNEHGKEIYITKTAAQEANDRY